MVLKKDLVEILILAQILMCASRVIFRRRRKSRGYCSDRPIRTDHMDHNILSSS